MIYFLAFWILLFFIYVILSIIIKIKKIKARPDYDSWIQSFDKKYNIREDFSIETTLAGVNHENREHTLIKSIKKGVIKKGSSLILLPDPENIYDNTATKVYTTTGLMIGFLPDREWNDKIFTDLMKGKRWDASVKKILMPSQEFNNHNLLIELWEYTENLTTK